MKRHLKNENRMTFGHPSRGLRSLGWQTPEAVPFPTFESLEDRRLLSAYVVNTLSDLANPGAGLLTFRQAVMAANAHGGADTITFAPSLFSTPGRKTVTLSQGEIDFNDASGTTTVIGPGSAKLAINAHNASRIFAIAAQSTVSLSGLTLTNGSAPHGADGNSEGGAINNAGSLSLTDIVVSNCTAQSAAPSVFDPTTDQGTAEGGGIYSTGSLALKNSTVTGNSALGASNIDSPTKSYGGSASGGGIYDVGPLTLAASTISHNTAAGGAAGVYNGEYSFGGAATGGGICDAGPAGAAFYVSSSTISGNAAVGGNASSPDTSYGGNANGGGIDTAVTLSISGTTVSANTASGGTAPLGHFPGGIALSYAGGAFGGGIDGDAVNVSNCAFSSNIATGGAAGEQYFDGYGGAALGGAIDANALSTTGSSFTKNQAVGGNVGGNDSSESAGLARGGAVWAGGSTTIVSSSFMQNSVIGGDALNWAVGGDALGAGIYLQQSTLHLIDSTVAGNIAQGGNSADTPGNGYINGGNATAGIFAGSGTVRLINSTVANNVATGGQGSAVGSSQAGAGGTATGAIFSAQGFQAYDSTISGNIATGGKGGGASTMFPGGPIGAAVGGISNPSKQGLLDNTIVSANKGNGVFSDIGDYMQTASAYNLIGVGGGLTNGVNGNKVGVTNPKLSSLGNFGGPTMTMYPLPGSPAINAGSNSLIPAGFNTDQRGLPRIVSGKVDIGAVEFSQVAITGDIYNDLNANGSRQTGEPGLGNWQAYVDLTNVGYYVAGDPIATTNSLGNYTLTFSPITVPGQLIIREIVKTGWRRTQPPGNWPLGYYSINPSAGIVSNVNFGNAKVGV